MQKINRRYLFGALGLGAGATLLGPIYETLVREAQAAPLNRKAFVVLLNGQGNFLPSFTPIEAQAQDGFSMKGCGRVFHQRGELLPGSFTWPEVFKPLERWHSKSLILDGLALSIKSSQHTCGFSTLSGITTLGGTPENGGLPAGPSIDQFIATGISANTPIKSLLFGGQAVEGPLYSNVFASGASKPEAHFITPSALYQRLFGSVPQASVGGAPALNKQRILMDMIRKDIPKLQANLVGIERRKLDDYLAVIEDHERRLESSPALSCDLAALAGDPRLKPGVFTEDKLEVMTELAMLALSCGATNVVGIAAANDHGHKNPPKWGRIHKEFGSKIFIDDQMRWPGHGGPDLNGVKVGREISWPEAARIIYPFLSSLLARLADGMAKVDVGGKTLLDNSVLLFTNDNGLAHHDMEKNRWPMLVIGDAGGALGKVDGRYLRFGDASCSTNAVDNTKEATLADYYCTLATALGVPTTTFGQGGPLKVSGPIAELINV